MIPLMKKAFLNELETKKALADFILKTDKLSMGAVCEKFEKAFAKKQGCRNAILFNSGGSANLAMLQALKNLGWIKNDDAVGFSALTWSTNIMPIIQMRMKPIAIDCDKNTLNTMSHNLLERLKQVKLDALFITNVLGFTGDINKIRDICKEKNIVLMEDNCEALGTELPDGKAGNFGIGASFSFFVAHHMSTIEGGMVCTDNEDLAEMLRIVRANGWDRNLSSKQQKKWREKYNIHSEFEAKYIFYDLAFNIRPTEITGFLGLSQLQFLDETTKKREGNFLQLEKVMSKNNDLIQLKHDHIKTLPSFGIPIICKTPELREKYIARFNNAGIEIRSIISGNMQKQPFYKKYVKNIFNLPNTDFIHNNGFYCGNYPELSTDDIETISSCLNQH